MELRPIGQVKSQYRKRSDCPKQGHEAGLSAEIVIHPEYLPALQGLQPGKELFLMTWLHEGGRDILQCHPRGDPGIPKTGIFMTRSPDRPNPIGLHQVRLLHMSENTLYVHPLEVIDATPVLDIKPVLSGFNQTDWGVMISAHEGEAFRDIGRAGREKGLLSGFNGNLSCRQEERVIITCSGSVKGSLGPGDLVCLDSATGRAWGPGAISSESPMHLALYRRQPEAKAIVHTHPVKLLALSLRGPEALLDLPLFEAGLIRDMLTEVEPLEPGSQQLAEAVAAAARGFKAIFLQGHGLVCWEDSLSRALALSEEIESLAAVQLHSRS
ncbi:MAG: tRNA (N6-threonylcarbamoyladenosine(37)-N6)-methyltransferase TrmO [Desulfohalobiaceae bacterium]|nr:tRNA (N6-threonylcarbamoyladenosine(37)-N6)-methyltransferase TrmO [Desulfohalobiaceae bacterium]